MHRCAALMPTFQGLVFGVTQRARQAKRAGRASHDPLRGRKLRSLRRDLVLVLPSALRGSIHPNRSVPDVLKYYGSILGLYWDNGKENGNYYLGFWGLGYNYQKCCCPAQEALGPASTAAQLAIAARAYPKPLLVKTGQASRSRP